MAYSTTAQEFQYIGDILKEFFAPAIINQVYKKAPFWAQIKKVSKGVYGKNIYIPVVTAFSEAVGSRVANDYSLPTAKKSTFDSSTISMKRNYGRIQVDGFAIESAKGRGGWVDIVSAESKNIANSFAIDVDRQSMGRGTGIIGLVASVSTTAVTVDDPYGIASLGSGFNMFRAGMVLDGWDVSETPDVKDIDSSTISSISGQVLTMDADCSALADGDYLTREDVYSTTAVNIGDMMGLDGIIDSSNVPGTSLFQNIDRSSVTEWQAHEDSTSQAISEDVIQVELDAIEQRTDGEAPNFGLTTYAIRNKLIDLIRADRQISTMDLKGGWTAIKYIGGSVEIPVMVHKFCPTGYFYFISFPHIKFYTLKNLVWDNKGGGIVKPVADYDAYEAWFKMYGNIGTDMPNSMGKLSGLTTS